MLVFRAPLPLPLRFRFHSSFVGVWISRYHSQSWVGRVGLQGIFSEWVGWGSMMLALDGLVCRLIVPRFTAVVGSRWRRRRRRRREFVGRMFWLV